MQMALEARPWTRRDLDRLPDDGNRYEVVDGALFVTPAPSAAHQRIVAALSALITPFVVANGVGVVHQARSVMVDAASQVEPDLMVLPPATFEAWEEAPVPILVVEVLSQTTRRRDLEDKRRFYLAKGVEEYWIVDREARSILRVRPSGAEKVTGVMTWAPRTTQAALEVDVAALLPG